MKNHFLTLLLILCAWPGASTAQAASPGTVVAWGADEFSCNAPRGLTPVPVAVQSGVTAIAAGGLVEGCTFAFGYTVALKSDGSVLAWGSYGPTNVPDGLSGVTAIAAGAFQALALKHDGSVLAWEYNYCGETDVPIGAQSGVTAIAAGGGHSVALKNDGTVVAWGGAHTVALKNDGTVVAWGDNNAGQVTGTPATSFPSFARANPVTLGGQVLSGVTAIAAAGWGHTVALVGTVPMLPALRARPSGNELILSWSTNAVGFTLQSAPRLTPPVTWMDSTNPPAVLDAQFTVTNTLAGPAQFYRLRKP